MTEERLRRMLGDAMPGASLVRAWPLTGGISAAMTAFEVEEGGVCRTLIARQPQSDEAAHQFRVLEAVREAGLKGPPPIFLERGERPCLVVGYVEGAPELGPRDVPAYLDRYAAALAEIHRAELPLPPDRWGFAPRPGPLNDSMREGEIREALNTFDPAPRANRPGPCHGDLWPGNVLWRDGEIAAVIDWEEARTDDPLADLAICRLDLLWILGEAAMRGFTDRYHARAGIDLANLPYWDLRASLRPIRNLEEWAPNYPMLGRPDVTEATMRRDHGVFVAQALAAIGG